MASALADMWNNGLLLFYGSIALVIALDVAVAFAGDREEPADAPQPPPPVGGRGLGAMIEGTP